jgi:hypothetical protein
MASDLVSSWSLPGLAQELGSEVGAREMAVVVSVVLGPEEIVRQAEAVATDPKDPVSLFLAPAVQAKLTLSALRQRLAQDSGHRNQP